jgi:hypothetical protein
VLLVMFFPNVQSSISQHAFPDAEMTRKMFQLTLVERRFDNLNQQKNYFRKKVQREIQGRSYDFSVEISPGLNFSDPRADEGDFQEVDSVMTNCEFLLYLCT